MKRLDGIDLQLFEQKLSIFILSMCLSLDVIIKKDFYENNDVLSVQFLRIHTIAVKYSTGL